MMCNVKKLRKIGFFDEDYFLYWEDIDLCFKAWGKGYRSYSTTDLDVWHLIGGTSKKNHLKEKLMLRNHFCFYLTNCSSWYSFFKCFLINQIHYAVISNRY